MSRCRTFALFGLSLVAVLGLAMATYAAVPALSGLTPAGLQRGTEVHVSITGARLGDAQELLFYSPGIQTLELKAEADNVVNARLAVAGDCRVGIHAVRLRTASGISDLRLFTVGVLPEVAEQEPNSEFAAPQAVPRDCTISGVVENEDVDHFVVEAKKGERITAELEGIRLGYTFFDPYLAILNSERFELSRSDDATLVRQDCLCAVVAPEDGKYIIQVRESAYGGNGSCRYRLHVGRFPRPLAVFPPGGKPGQTLTVNWIGDPAGDRTQELTLPGPVPGDVGLFAEDEFGIAPSPNTVRVVDLENVLEVEPNDAAPQATPAAAPSALNGILGQAGDVDTFKFSAKKGQQFDIRVHSRSVLRSPLDSVLVVRRSNGAVVGSNDDSGGPDSYVQFNAPEDDDYFVEISDHLRAGGPSYVYRIEISPIQPTLTLTLPERQQYVPVTLAVPRGNRMALMVNASRANWGGELTVTAEGLPPGISVQAPNMAADSNSIPMLFTAAPDAPLAGSLTDLVGRPVDETLKFAGHLAQRTMLVRGQNNLDVWGHDADRMAAAVIEEMPFQVEIVQPKSPIARQGSKNLKVVATRKEGFQQPIAISLLYNPPGIGSSGSVTIPADQNEAFIPLTANASAAIGTWPIIVIGQATVGNGNVEVATQMAELAVSDSFLNLTIDKAAAEVGKATEVVIHVENKVPFEGEAEVRLMGLPANTSATPEVLTITKDSTQVVFPVTVTDQAKPGTYKSLVSTVVIVQNGEQVPHTLGSGELRVDEPLPPKVAAAPPEEKPAPQPPAAESPPPKRLSRLEQLRQEKKSTPGGTP
ncbi:MAG: peptidase [Planctomycetes bacterium]|nr:peptidase [Planctomycetota bacterium]